MSDQQIVDETKQEPSQEQQLPEILKKHADAPSQEQIEKWKIQHSEIYVSGFSETELFVWRPIKRPEFVQIQTIASDPEAKLDQYKLEEMVCDTCVLWRSNNVPWDQGKAGTPQSLSEQIMQNSNFLSPQAAAMLVAKL